MAKKGKKYKSPNFLPNHQNLSVSLLFCSLILLFFFPVSSCGLTFHFFLMSLCLGVSFFPLVFVSWCEILLGVFVSVNSSGEKPKRRAF